MRETAFLKAYLAPLVGGKITKVGVTADGFPQITVKVGKETFVLEVSRDSEGNGPGFLFGLPRVGAQKG